MSLLKDESRIVPDLLTDVLEFPVGCSESAQLRTLGNRPIPIGMRVNWKSESLCGQVGINKMQSRVEQNNTTPIVVAW